MAGMDARIPGKKFQTLLGYNRCAKKVERFSDHKLIIGTSLMAKQVEDFLGNPRQIIM